MDSQEKETGTTDYKVKEEVDRDAQDQVIASLRTQIQDLISQVSQLNSKLVKSYDRVSDLEDDLHVASASLRSSVQKVSQLELERTQHLAALNTGLLVEKTHVTAELTRLMEKATEEAAQRGQAESARMAIEKDLDDLSANLFNQANTMVAEARYEKHLSERKVEAAERTLKSAEEAVQLMQTQMQALQAEKEKAEADARERQLVMGPGKWGHKHILNAPLRLLSAHTPYQDYLAFLSHLRVLHLTSPNPPAMPTLLPLPFLTRLLNEDSEPTIRLDLAPSLNWLSRRSVLAAIHAGQLTIEPISSVSLLTESHLYPTSTISGLSSNGDHLSCALCGTSIYPPPNTHPNATNTTDSSGSPHPSRHPALPLFGGNVGGSSGATSSAAPSNSASTPTTTRQSISWSPGSFFKRASTSSNHTVNQHDPNSSSVPPSPTTRVDGPNATPTSTPPPLPPANPYKNLPPQIFIFKISSPASSSSLPIPLLVSKSHSNSNSVGSASTYHHHHHSTGSNTHLAPSHPTNGTSSSTSSTNLLTPSLSHSSSTSSSSTHGLSLITSTPSSSSTTTIYPLCASGWCLARLRTTCTLWAFIRSGVVDRVWEEDLSVAATSAGGLNGYRKGSGGPSSLGVGASPTQPNGTAVNGSSVSAGGGVNGPGAVTPVVPPKKRGIWGIASAIGIGGGDKSKVVAPAPAPATTPAESKTLPPPPPPMANTTKEETKPSTPPPPPALPVRRVPPPLPPSSSSASVDVVGSGNVPEVTQKEKETTVPPPLPKRSEGRSRRPSPQLPTEAVAAEPVVVADAKPEEETKEKEKTETSNDAPTSPSPPATIPTTPPPPHRPSTPVSAARRSIPSRPASPAVPSRPQTPTRRPTTTSVSGSPSSSPSRQRDRDSRRISADFSSASVGMSTSPPATSSPLAGHTNQPRSTSTSPARSVNTHRPASPSVGGAMNSSKRASLGMMLKAAVNVPLPESRPGTPGLPAAAAGAGSRPGTPSGVASGNVAAGAGGAPPPPLPRRAAARGSRVPGATGGSVTASPNPNGAVVGSVSTPPSASNTPPPPPAAPVVLEMVDEAESVSLASASNSDPSLAPAPEAEAEAKVDPTTTTTTAPISTGTAIEPVTSQSNTSDGDVFVDATEDVVGVHPTTPKAAVEEEVKVKDGDAVRDGEQEKRALERVDDVLVEEPSSSSAGKGEEKDEKEKEEKGDDENPSEDAEKQDPFVTLLGDSTWEEKTWREIVRLREDMFWARVGALRDV